MDHTEQPVLRFIPDQSLTEDALSAAVEQIEDQVTKALSLTRPPEGEFLQVVVFSDLGWNTALVEYKGDTSAFVDALLGVRRQLVSVRDPDRDNKMALKAVQLDVTLFGDEASSPIVARKATATSAGGGALAPERSTLILQRQWGLISTHPATRAEQLVALASLAAEGWRLENDGQTIELLNPEEPALEWGPRSKTTLSRSRTTTIAIYFKGTLTPPIAMQAGWGTIQDGARKVALSVDASGKPLKLSFAPEAGGRGSVALSAPGWRPSRDKTSMVRLEDFSAAVRRGGQAPTRTIPTPSLAEWRSAKLLSLSPSDQDRFRSHEAATSQSHGGHPACPLFVHHDLSHSLAPTCRTGGGCMLTSRPGFDPSMSYVPCMTPHMWAQNAWSGGNAWQGGRAGGKGSDQGGGKPTKGGGKPAAANNGGQGGGKPTEGGGKPAAAYDGGRGGGKPTTGGGKPAAADVGDGGRGRGATSVAGAQPAAAGAAGGPIAGAYGSRMIDSQYGSMGPPMPVVAPSSMEVDSELAAAAGTPMGPPPPRPSHSVQAAAAVTAGAAELESAAVMPAAEAEASQLENAWAILRARLAAQWEAIGRLECSGMDPAERSSIYDQKAATQVQQLLKLPLGQVRAMKALELWHENQSRCKAASERASSRPSRADSEAGGSGRSRDSSAER